MIANNLWTTAALILLVLVTLSPAAKLPFGTHRWTIGNNPRYAVAPWRTTPHQPCVCSTWLDKGWRRIYTNQSKQQGLASAFWTVLSRGRHHKERQAAGASEPSTQVVRTAETGVQHQQELQRELDEVSSTSLACCTKGCQSSLIKQESALLPTVRTSRE